MSWDKNKLKTFSSNGILIPASDDRIESYREDTMLRGNPDLVLIARDEKDVRDAMSFCNSNKIPVTVCGSQTSMTGSSVATEGLLISTERLEGVVDIYNDKGENLACVNPGTVVADLQKAVADAGFFYPVGPTSCDECRIGANIATNATGEDSYKYGPVREYVRALELVLPSGTKKVFKREPNEKPSRERNRAGYFVGWKNPIDLIIASEGTLGFVSKIWLKLLPVSADFFTVMIPFPSNIGALKFVCDTVSDKFDFKPRALEFIDNNALKMMKTAEGFPKLSDNVVSFIYTKLEHRDAHNKDDLMMKLYEAVIPHIGEILAEQILIADTNKQKEEFRLWRHRIPEAVNEWAHKYWPVGGCKVGGDWWVPVENIVEMMEYFYKIADDLGLPHMGYAHIGCGNPHTNFLTVNPEEKLRAHEALISCCRKAIELGGGVAGEHGIGKINTDLVPLQYDSKVIEKMCLWKTEFDPNWILGRGNILPVSYGPDV